MHAVKIGEACLQLPDSALLLLRFEVLFVSQYKGCNEVKEDRGSESDEGKVDEGQSDASGLDTHLFTHPCTYTEGLALMNGPYVIECFFHHISKCSDLHHSSNKLYYHTYWT